MNRILSAFAVLLLAAGVAHARGGGGRGFVGGRGAVRSSGFSSGFRASSGGARGFGFATRASVSRGRAIFGAATRRATSGFFARRDAPTSGGSTTTQTPPPYYYTPGALIRTAGQLPVYADPHDATTHAVDGGGFVSMDERNAHSVGAAPSVRWGAPDRAPSSGGGGAGGNGVTTNGGPAFDLSF